MTLAHAEGTYAVLAMRGIRESKTRLAGAVPPPQRAVLNRWLLERTLGVVHEWLGDLTRCVFVSACDEALGIAWTAGAWTLVDEGGARGHNQAAEQASAHAITLGARRIVRRRLADCSRS